MKKSIITFIGKCLVLPLIFSTCFVLNVSCSSDDDDKGINTGEELWHEPLRIGTYNIQYDNLNDPVNTWESRNKILEPQLKALDFDIFGSQEPYINQLDDMMKYLPEYTYIGKSITGEVGVARRHYVPIFYKTEKFEVLKDGMFWLSETPNIPNSKGWDAYSVRVCVWAQFKDKTTGKEFYHFNTHFDHIGVEAKRQSATLLLQKIKDIAGDSPCFVTGDFNSNQKTVAYNTLVTSNTIVDSRGKAEKRTNEDWPTFNDYKLISTPAANATRIDHVFINAKGTRVKSWEIVNKDFKGKYPSDHFPIIVEWCLRK